MQDTKKTEKREGGQTDNKEGMISETQMMLKDQQGKEWIQIMRKTTRKKKERKTRLGITSMDKKTTTGTTDNSSSNKNRHKLKMQQRTMNPKIIDVN